MRLGHASLSATCSNSRIASLLPVRLAALTATSSLQVAVEDGSMMVCVGSHRMRSFAKLRDGYGGSQVSPRLTSLCCSAPCGAMRPVQLTAVSSTCRSAGMAQSQAG